MGRLCGDATRWNGNIEEGVFTHYSKCSSERGLRDGRGLGWKVGMIVVSWDYSIMNACLD